MLEELEKIDNLIDKKEKEIQELKIKKEKIYKKSRRNSFYSAYLNREDEYFEFAKTRAANKLLEKATQEMFDEYGELDYLRHMSNIEPIKDVYMFLDEEKVIEWLKNNKILVKNVLVAYSGSSYPKEKTNEELLFEVFDIH